MVAVGKRDTLLPSHRSRRALLTHRAAGASAGPLVHARGRPVPIRGAPETQRGDPQAAFEGLRERGYPETVVELARKGRKTREGLKKGAEILAPFVVLLWREARCLLAWDRRGGICPPRSLTPARPAAGGAGR